MKPMKPMQAMQPMQPVKPMQPMQPMKPMQPMQQKTTMQTDLDMGQAHSQAHMDAYAGRALVQPAGPGAGP